MDINTDTKFDAKARTDIGQNTNADMNAGGDGGHEKKKVNLSIGNLPLCGVS